MDDHYRALYQQALVDEPIAPWERDTADRHRGQDTCRALLGVFLEARVAAVEGGDTAEAFDALPLDGTAGADLLDAIDKYLGGDSGRLTSIDYAPDDFMKLDDPPPKRAAGGAKAA